MHMIVLLNGKGGRKSSLADAPAFSSLGPSARFVLKVIFYLQGSVPRRLVSQTTDTSQREKDPKEKKRKKVAFPLSIPSSRARNVALTLAPLVLTAEKF